MDFNKKYGQHPAMKGVPIAFYPNFAPGTVYGKRFIRFAPLVSHSFACQNLNEGRPHFFIFSGCKNISLFLKNSSISSAGMATTTAA